MVYKTEGDKYAEDIEAARVRVGKAMQAYNRGTVTLNDVNRANDALSEAHRRWRECADGRVPDDR
jgi:hypothetical protein